MSPLPGRPRQNNKSPLAGAFKYAMALGLIHEGVDNGGWAKTEVNALRVGDVMVSTVPGELYSEIALGVV